MHMLMRFFFPSILVAAFVSSAVSAPEPATDSIALVRRFADAMIDHSLENCQTQTCRCF
jgi:hypothetical protein